ncbi:hypothetical protein [Duganella vulcania]|uniref:Uncharacterized protein n=1 Tax=Duganella vulcania TaxID=2692166 RepID=A0A845GCU6_9BURK|nr:hypothetical protein [Duganella vulcania]MYM92443.1 hypothetical protein [Duganella vulcania]
MSSFITKLCCVGVVLAVGAGTELSLYGRYVALGAPAASGQGTPGLSAGLGPASGCTAAPEAGTTTVPPALGLSTAGTDGVLSIKNDLRTLVVVVLGDTGLTSLSRAIAVGGNSKVSVRMVPGSFGFGVMVGERWCNLGRGFLGGAKYAISGGIPVKTGVVTQAMIRPGADAGDVKVTYRTFPDPGRAAQTIDLVRSGNGFVKIGTVNGMSAALFIDPKTPVSVISSSFARDAGIECSAAIPDDAGDLPAGACLGLAAAISLGPFTVHDVPVAIMPGPSRYILGANVLRHFRVESDFMTMHIAQPMTAELELQAGALARTQAWPQPAGVERRAHGAVAMANLLLASRSHLASAMAGVGLVTLIIAVALLRRRAGTTRPASAHPVSNRSGEFYEQKQFRRPRS